MSIERRIAALEAAVPHPGCPACAGWAAFAFHVAEEGKETPLDTCPACGRTRDVLVIKVVYVDPAPAAGAA